MLKRKQENRGPIRTDDCGRKGDYWEALVELEAWKRGAEVYPNKGCTGKIDIILEIEGQFVPIDVKVLRWSKNRQNWSSSGKCADGVYKVAVNPETFEIRWDYTSSHRTAFKCPPGLENFWS